MMLPLPLFAGEGDQAEGLGGEGLADCGVQTLTSHPLRGGPLLSRKDGRGFLGRFLATGRAASASGLNIERSESQPAAWSENIPARIPMPP